jgi:hypothetical protein
MIYISIAIHHGYFRCPHLIGLVFAGPRTGNYVYQGCFQDSSGPYDGGNTLPDALNTNGVTIDQCARAAGLRRFDVFALQGSGLCFMGKLADLARIASTEKLAESSCSRIPCAIGVECTARINKVYSIGAP